MQKIPEISDRKKGRRMRKDKGISWQKEEAHPLSVSDQRSDNTLLTSGTLRVRLWTTRRLVLSIVALVSVNSMLKYKSYEMDPWITNKNTGLGQTPKSNGHIVKDLKYQMRTHIY